MKNFARILLLITALFVIASLFGCSKVENNDDKIIVAVSIVPQKTFVEAVCGDEVEVLVMIPPGYSPENYEPAPRDIEKFQASSIYFAIGVQAEDSNILPEINEYDFPVVKLQDEVAKVYKDIDIDHGERDPHIWLSPKRVKVMVEIIADEMSLLDPDNGPIYRENAGKFLEELDKADSDIKKVLDGVETRKFIVFHPAFGYFADEYDLEMYALEEHGKEATAQRLREMIDFAKSEGIKTVFHQAETSARQALSFAEEIGGKTVELEPLAPDYIENLKAMAKLMSETME